jgi:hypothetical protein
VRTDLNYLLFDGERERMLNHMMFGGERSFVDGFKNEQGPKEHTLFFTIFLFVCLEKDCRMCRHTEIRHSIHRRDKMKVR